MLLLLLYWCFCAIVLMLVAIVLMLLLLGYVVSANAIVVSRCSLSLIDCCFRCCPCCSFYRCWCCWFLLPFNQAFESSKVKTRFSTHVSRRWEVSIFPFHNCLAFMLHHFSNYQIIFPNTIFDGTIQFVFSQFVHFRFFLPGEPMNQRIKVGLWWYILFLFLFLFLLSTAFVVYTYQRAELRQGVTHPVGEKLWGISSKSLRPKPVFRKFRLSIHTRPSLRTSLIFPVDVTSLFLMCFMIVRIK